MAVSRMAQAEVCFAIRQMWTMVPALDAPTADRAWFELYKAELMDLLGVMTPEVAAQAARARQQARAIISDY